MFQLLNTPRSNPIILMPGFNDRLTSVMDRSQKALLLHGQNLSANDRNLAALLDFFGVPWNSVILGEVDRERDLSSHLAKNKSRIPISASHMAVVLQVTKDLERRPLIVQLSPRRTQLA